eukprot:9044087-Prorocentrum_lima.AAC.1
MAGSAESLACPRALVGGSPAARSSAASCVSTLITLASSVKGGAPPRRCLPAGLAAASIPT